ncbi:Transposase domain [Burkholderia sp. D7]|nr:Transposase domain [Burkholderia sp. D7]
MWTMPEQRTLSAEADGEFEARREPIRLDVSLAAMDKMAPWAELCAVIEPFYPEACVEGGRRPVGLKGMPRIHFPQQWCALNDPTVEEALYNSASMRRFVGIDLGRGPAPEEAPSTRPRPIA